MEEQYDTRYTLIQRALDTGDEQAWEELVGHYRRFITYVLTRLNVFASDIDDISQQVLLALLKDLPKFDREKGRFRSWLSAIIRNTAVNYIRKQQRHQDRVEGFRQESLDRLEQSPEIEAYIEKEWTTYIATQAMNRVRGMFEGQAIRVFEMSLDGDAAAQIAEATGLTVSTVYTLKKRVKKQLCLEILNLTEGLER